MVHRKPFRTGMKTYWMFVRTCVWELELGAGNRQLLLRGLYSKHLQCHTCIYILSTCSLFIAPWVEQFGTPLPPGGLIILVTRRPEKLKNRKLSGWNAKLKILSWKSNGTGDIKSRMRSWEKFAELLPSVTSPINFISNTLLTWPACRTTLCRNSWPTVNQPVQSDEVAKIWISGLNYQRLLASKPNNYKRLCTTGTISTSGSQIVTRRIHGQPNS